MFDQCVFIFIKNCLLYLHGVFIIFKCVGNWFMPHANNEGPARIGPSLLVIILHYPMDMFADHAGSDQTVGHIVHQIF